MLQTDLARRAPRRATTSAMSAPNYIEGFALGARFKLVDEPTEEAQPSSVVSETLKCTAGGASTGASSPPRLTMLPLLHHRSATGDTGHQTLIRQDIAASAWNRLKPEELDHLTEPNASVS